MALVTDTPTRAGLYLRISTAHRAATGISLEEQEYCLRAGAEHGGLPGAAIDTCRRLSSGRIRLGAGADGDEVTAGKVAVDGLAGAEAVWGYLGGVGAPRAGLSGADAAG